MAIAGDIAKGAAWVLMFKAISRGLGLVSMFILARLLSPGDFGVVALAMAMITALELAGNFSFDVALIQNQDATPQHYNTVWTITLAFQSVIALILMLSAKPMADIFNEPELASALMVLAIVPVLDGLQNIRIVDFRKKMMFQKDFAFFLTKRLIGLVVTIPLAFILRNYWALIIGAICGRVGGVIVSYVLLPHMPKFGAKHWQELFGFSKWMFANNILFFIRNRASSFIIGKMTGTQSLGYYEVSNEVSSMPITELVAPINRAVLPGLSKVNNEPQVLAENYLRIVGMVMLLAIPAGVGISAVAEPLVHVVLGTKWLDAIPVITILGIVGAIGCTESNTSTTCLALGRPDLVTKLYAIYASLLLILVIWFTSFWGLMGAAWAMLCAALINAPIFYSVLLKVIGVKPRRFFGILWRPLVSCATMFICVRVFLEGSVDFAGSLSTLPSLLAAVIIGAFVYIASIALLWMLCGRPQSPEHDALVQVAKKIPSINRLLSGNGV